jgi:hypothetical protein
MAFQLLSSPRMRRTIAVVVLLASLSSRTVHADDVHSARAMKLSGIVLTLVGSLALTAIPVAWAVVWSRSNNAYDNAGVEEALAEGVLAMSILGGIGVAHIAVGIPLWSVGSAREKRARSFSVRLSATGLPGTF